MAQPPDRPDDGNQRPLRESDVLESNLAELPVFVLNVRDAKRHLIREFSRTIVRNGRALQQTIKIKANSEDGHPTTFTGEVLFAVLSAAERQGFASQKVPINRAEIARGIHRPLSGKTYQLIDGALRAAASTVIETQELWLDPTTDPIDGKVRRKRHPGIHVEHMVKSFRLGQTTFGAVSATPADTDDFIELGDSIWESAKSRYLTAIDLAYCSALSPTANRLYWYLTKRDRYSAEWKEGLQSLAFHLGLKKRAPSAIQSALGPASDELCNPFIQNGQHKQFLASYSFDMSRRGEETMSFVFARAASVATELRRRLAARDTQIPLLDLAQVTTGDETWLRLAAAFRATFTGNTAGFDAAFQGVQGSLHEGTLTLLAPDTYTVSRLEDLYVPGLEQLASDLLGREISVAVSPKPSTT
jgi:hypothetical protein